MDGQTCIAQCVATSQIVRNRMTTKLFEQSRDLKTSRPLKKRRIMSHKQKMGSNLPLIALIAYTSLTVHPEN